MPSAACKAWAVAARSADAAAQHQHCRQTLHRQGGGVQQLHRGKHRQGGAAAVTLQRNSDAGAAQAVRPAGPRRSTSRRPRANSRISATMPSAISKPIRVSL